MKKRILKTIKILGGIIIIVLLIALLFPTWTANIKEENSISELKQIEINGTKHEVMIRGKNLDNPIILVVHGGPACSEIPYVTKYQDLLEEKFTIVQYDQRASGKSYHFFEDYSNLTTDLLVKDLLAMTDYITNRFGKEKVILLGHSFGTYLSTIAASEVPEKYEAYIGIGQMSDIHQSEVDSLNYCIEQAKLNNNDEDLTYLQSLIPQTESEEMFYTPRNYVRKYGGAARLIDDNADYTTGFLFGSEYNLLDVIRYNRGVATSQDVLLLQSFEKPLPSIVTNLNLPFYFVMGKYDYMTSASAAKTYFDTITTDKEKEFVVFESSAHYPHFEEKEAFYQWMCERIGE